MTEKNCLIASIQKQESSGIIYEKDLQKSFSYSYG